MQSLQQENQQLRKQLNQLLHNARENQQKQQRFEQFEFSLMSAASIEAVISCLEEDFLERFNYDVASLLLLNEQFTLSQLLPETVFNQSNNQFLQLLTFPAQRKRLEKLTDAIFTGRYSVTQHHWLLQYNGVKSIAVLPLIFRGQKLGVFCCGSRNEDRFDPKQANDFFKRLAFIISVCIDNALTREKLKLTGLTDPLTKVRNRRFFDERLSDEISRQKRTRSPLSCILFDIDHFKQVNDTHGHLAGDNILIEVAQRVQKVLRSHEVLVRYGGEEFAVLIPDTDNEAAKCVAQRIISSIRRSGFPVNSDALLNITVSAGIATLSADKYHDRAELVGNKLVSSADRALYEAKELGRNREMNAGILSLAEIAAESSVTR